MGVNREAADTDGRTRRRARNRDAVVDAVLELFELGDLDPTIDAIAARAGVSNRSIYRYFDHRDHLVRAAITQTLRRVVSEVTFEQVRVGTFDERVASFVAHRLALYDQLASVLRAGRVASVAQPIIGEELDVGSAMLHQQIIDHFAFELAEYDAPERLRITVTVEMAFQFDAIEFLGGVTDRSLDAVHGILTDHLHTTFGRIRRHASS